MNRKPSVPLVILLALVIVSAGCLTTNDDDVGDHPIPPPVGTTEGFTFPDIQFSDVNGSEHRMEQWTGNITIVHVISSTQDVFEPQIPQIRRVLESFDNLNLKALTITSGNDTMSQVESMVDAMNITWTAALPMGDLASDLSIVKPLTVFLLRWDRVILVRSDEVLGQARMIQAIEESWDGHYPEDAFPQVGSTVQDLVWRDLDGEEGSLSDLEGAPVLLNVWEMECPFCLDLFEDLERIWTNYSNEGLQMVSIDLITWETEDQVRGVMKQYNATWTFAIDGDNIQSRYDIWRLPLLVLLDADGVVQWTWTGYTHWSVIEQEVEKLI